MRILEFTGTHSTTLSLYSLSIVKVGVYPLLYFFCFVEELYRPLAIVITSLFLLHIIVNIKFPSYIKLY